MISLYHRECLIYTLWTVNDVTEKDQFLSAKKASLTDRHVGGLSNSSCPVTSLTIYSIGSFSTNLKLNR